MSAEDKHEIVIIRRGGHGDHDEHHGGVWKIAFADFMTAMMAFFLVMWLISANDKTRASVARYFNPVRLVDATTQPRGLHDPKKDESGITASPNSKETKEKDSKGPSMDMSKEASDKKPEGPQPNETPRGRVARLDATLRDNPFVALAEIAASKGASDSPPTDASRASAPVIGREGGPAFRDPFAPQPQRRVDLRQPDDEADTATKPPGPTPPGPTPPVPTPAAAKAKAAVDPAIVALKQSAPGGPDLDVERTSEGLLLRLTDTQAFSMFANGSAVPARRVVLMMERVGKILAGRSGAVIIRGYTDNKRFRTGRYDNWNLSMDRAQAAHYMLVRGGLADTRVAAVEGFADHGVKPGVDPASPTNRRIEILLKDDAR